MPTAPVGFHAVGIGMGGGSEEFLSHWMIDSEPPCDLPIVYPLRFSTDLMRDGVLEKIARPHAQGHVLSEGP